MEDHITVLVRLAFSLLVGVVVGIERAMHGRPAGLRTHALVCVSSTVLILLTVFQWELLAGVPMETLRIDPTRMAQGIMTGIGFLGAGVIMKERFTVRGLTTAASIWMTASLGIIIGMGFYFAATLATALTLLVLSVFRWFERLLPVEIYGLLMVRCSRADAIPKEKLMDVIREHNIQGTAPSYQLEDGRRFFRYEMTIRTRDATNFYSLSEALSGLKQVSEFSVIPSGD
jgi:putative Mg2+ transporter-C (MgtC) family protein